jgi:hypothetical protein
LRYGVYDKINPEFLAEAKQYRLDAIQVDREWHLLSTYLPNIESNLRSRQPLWSLGRLRTSTRSFLERIGLLDRLYDLQAKTWKREI